MSNLEQGLERNSILLENKLARDNISKMHLLNIYGNLKFLEYRAVIEKENVLLYRIQKFILELEEFILE